MVKPADRKQVARRFNRASGLSERKACELAGISRTAYRRPPKPDKDKALKARLKELAELHPSYGHPMLHSLLKREGLVINKKRTYRLYREMALQLRRRKRKKLHRPKLAMDIPKGPNRRWSMDFLHRLSCGRRIKILNIVDDYSREVVGQLPGFSITGAQVARFLDRINRTGLPDAIVCDNGPEFTGKAMFFWGKRRAVKLNFIQPGKPTLQRLRGKPERQVPQ